MTSTDSCPPCSVPPSPGNYTQSSRSMKSLKDCVHNTLTPQLFLFLNTSDRGDGSLSWGSHKYCSHHHHHHHRLSQLGCVGLFWVWQDGKYWCKNMKKKTIFSPKKTPHNSSGTTPTSSCGWLLPGWLENSSANLFQNHPPAPSSYRQEVDGCLDLLKSDTSCSFWIPSCFASFLWILCTPAWPHKLILWWLNSGRSRPTAGDRVSLINTALSIGRQRMMPLPKMQVWSLFCSRRRLKAIVFYYLFTGGYVTICPPPSPPPLEQKGK